MLQPVPFETFGGLDLRHAVDESGGAIDLLNVTFQEESSVGTRNGSGALFSSGTATQVRSMGPFYTSTGTRQLLWNDGANTIAVTTGGVSPASTAQAAGPAASYVRFGSPTAETMYIVGGGTSRKWDGAAFTAPAGVPGAYTATVQAVDNRLVIAGNINGSRVSFSDPGLPETFSANNFVHLTPGDGEIVQNLVAWREMVFAFKQSKFFVFYGTSTGADGTPVFNYRPVVGRGTIGLKAACAANDGVYFVAEDGVYRTTGGTPELVSAALTPLFTGDILPSWTLGTINKAVWTETPITSFNNQVFFAVPLGSGARATVFQYDIPTQRWTAHQFPGTGNDVLALSSFTTATVQQQELMYGATVGGLARVMRHSNFFLDDSGAAITASYQSAFTTMGAQGEKTVRATLLDGVGTSIPFGWARDWGTAGSFQNVTMGIANTPAQARHRLAVRGRLLSWRVSSNSRWKLERVVALVRGARPPGAHTT